MHEDLVHAARKYRHYSEALYEALTPDPFYQALEARAEPTGDAREAMLTYYDYSMLEAVEYGILAEAGGAALGVSIWSLPLDAASMAEKSAQKKAVVRAVMGDACLEMYEGINASMGAASKPLTEATDWYLSILGLSPAHQGQGMGGSLISPVLEKADEYGAATYLETFTPRNMSFYERLGYQSVGSFREPVTGGDYWVMRRLPNAGR